MTAVSYAFSKLVCWLVFRFGHGLEVTGREHIPRSGPFIVACNHVSFLDPPVLGVACPRRLTFMARADLYAHRLLAWWLHAVGALALKREEADIAAFRKALAILQKGRPVAIFPEGTRQLSGALGAAKRGVGVLAEAARVPVVPAYVQGTFQALPPEATSLRPAKIRVAFGPPIAYNSRSTSGSAPRERHEQLATAVTDAWRALERQASR